MPAPRTPNRIGKVALFTELTGRKESPHWWSEEAKKATGQPCPKCQNPCTQGIYVAPHLLSGECAVVINCVLCGHESVVSRGWCHIPLDMKPIRVLPQLTQRPVKLRNNKPTRRISHA